MRVLFTRNFSVLLAVLFLCSPLFVQSKIHRDSLMTAWNDPNNTDTLRLQALNMVIVKLYLYSKPDSAYYYSQQMHDFAKEKEIDFYKGKALRIQGLSLYNQDEYNQAYDHYLSSLKVWEKTGNKKEKGTTLQNIGILFYSQGEYQNAIEYYTRSLKTFEELGFKKGIASSFNNIGLIYSALKEYDKTLEYYNKGLEIHEELKHHHGMANSLNNIGVIYLKQSEYDKALEYFDRSLEIKQKIGTKLGMAATTVNIGIIYESKEEFDLAYEEYSKGLALYQIAGSKSGVSGVLINIGSLFLQQDIYDSAISYSSRALDIAQKAGVPIRIKEASSILYKSLKKAGNSHEALAMYELYNKTKDSIASDENQREVIRQQFKYEFEKQKAEEEKIRFEREKAQEIAQTKNYIILFSGVGLLIILLSFAIFYVKSLRKRNNIIYSQKEELESTLSELSKLSRAIEQTPNTVVITDKDGKIEYVNTSFCETTGYSVEEIIGQKPSILKSGNMPAELYKGLWETISSGKTWIGEFENKKKNGELYSESSSISPIINKEGKITHYVAVKEDITEIKTAKAIAERATRTKSQFLATMSHEIRTPMNAIIGLANLALKTKLDPKQEDYLVKIESAGSSLLGIINDILDFSKIEAGKLDIENRKFDLEQVFIDIANLYANKAHSKGLEFSIRIANDVPFYLIGDPLRISQIITNYCSNAIKFTEKGDIVVNVELNEKLDDNKIKLTFSVQDSGIGLSTEQKNRMFKEFSQADSSTTRKYGGTGLGLAISKRLSELMGGTTWVESELDKGSTFYFSAVFEVQEQKKRIQFQPPVDIGRMNILACDDNSTARLIISETIKTFNFNIKTVATGQECIEELKGNTYNLLIIDYMMPEMDGLETVMQINTIKSINKIPIIMVSGFSNEEVKEQAKELGINSFINKPYSYSTVFDSIMEVFGKDIRIAKSKPAKGEKHAKAIKEITGTSILVVEDNEINQQVATEILEDVGFFVDIAANGKEAIEMLKISGTPSKYSLIFMDIQMPEMDGHTATKVIRTLKNYAEIPIVAMTADAISGVREECIESGMNDMVTKPIDIDEVFRAMTEWIKPTTAKDQIVEKESIAKQPEKNKSDEKETKIQNIQGLNVTNALNRLGNKNKLYVGMLKRFYTNNQNFITQLNEKLEKEEYEMLSRQVHTFKGITGSIGAESLHELSKTLEIKIKNKDRTGINATIKQISHDLNILMDNLANNLDFEVENENSASMDIKKVSELIQELKALLKTKNPKAKKIINELSNKGLQNDQISEMNDRINKYDFKGAFIALEEMEKVLK